MARFMDAQKHKGNSTYHRAAPLSHIQSLIRYIFGFIADPFLTSSLAFSISISPG